MGPSASSFDCQGWGTFLYNHCTPEALAEALDGNVRDKGSLSDVEWWEKDRDDEKDKGNDDDDDDDDDEDDEDDEEPLPPGW
jgi:hypothetical protein